MILVVLVLMIVVIGEIIVTMIETVLVIGIVTVATAIEDVVHHATIHQLASFVNLILLFQNDRRLLAASIHHIMEVLVTMTLDMAI